MWSCLIDEVEMVFTKEMNVLNSFNVGIYFENGRFSFCTFPNGITISHMYTIIRSHLFGPWEPKLIHLWYHVPPQFVEKGTSDFVFLRNDEGVQHVIHWHLVMVPIETMSFYVNFMKVEKSDNVCGPSSIDDGRVTDVSLWDVV